MTVALDGPRIESMKAAHLDAEFALLGAVLFDGEIIPRLDAKVSGAHFAEAFHGRLWEAMVERARKGQLVEPLSLRDRFAQDPAFIDLGGMSYLADMLDQAVPVNAGHFAQMVVDQAQRRELVDLGKTLSTEAASGTQSATDLIAKVEGFTAELARQSAAPAGEPVGLGALDMLEAAYAGGFAGISTGLECLDRITGGLQPDHVWIVGGRTSMGKSVKLPVLGRNIAAQGFGVLKFSLEMPKREVQARLIADIAYERGRTAYGDDPGNIKFGDVLRGRGERGQRDRAREAARQMASLPLVVSDRGGLTLDDIIGQSLRQMRAWEKAGVRPGAVLIDHLGLVRPSTGRDSKAAEVADTVDRLKEAAKRIGAPIIAAAQINRACENRNDKRPTMADLNWSGSIEQIADLVMLLYRDAYYLERSPKEEDQREAVFKEHELEIIVPKNRSGPTCTLHAFIDVACNAIRDKEERFSNEYRGRG
jgi:replicative DNA helicase